MSHLWRAWPACAMVSELSTRRGRLPVVTGLPPGWSLERIRTIEPQSEMLDVSSHDVFVLEGQDLQAVDARCIISFAGLCLVNPRDQEVWLMGELDTSDGSIVCWAEYGSDLAWAIKAL